MDHYSLPSILFLQHLLPLFLCPSLSLLLYLLIFPFSSILLSLPLLPQKNTLLSYQYSNFLPLPSCFVILSSFLPLLLTYQYWAFLFPFSSILLSPPQKRHRTILPIYNFPFCTFSSSFFHPLLNIHFFCLPSFFSSSLPILSLILKFSYQNNF